MKTRAFCWLLVSSLVPVRAAAEDLDVLLADLGMDCPTLVRSGGDLLEQVASEIEERLRWVDAFPAPASELAEMMSRLPAWRSVVWGREEEEIHGLVGDLFLVTGRLPPAMAAYGRAAEAGPGHAARCGLSYDGVVYTFELVESTARYRRSRVFTAYLTAPYLLVREATTGHVLERILLPTLPSAMAIDDGGLHVLYQSWNDPKQLRSVRWAQLRLDPVRVPEDFLSRLRSRKGSQSLAYNFLRKADEGNHIDRLRPDFTPRRDPVEGRPADLETLEAALRQAILRDPTQPWHLFFLGQCLWSDGRRAEAMDVWDDLLSGTYTGIPYFEFADMARYFELYQQPEWADAAFRVALERRRRLPVPIEWSYLIGRFVNVPTRWPFLERERWPDMDVERSYLWWLRLREITGVSEGDTFRAVLWASYFKSVGDIRRAAAESEYLDRTRQYPRLALWHWLAYWDYTAWFLLASLVGFLFLFAGLLAGVSKRMFRRLFSKRRFLPRKPLIRWRLFAVVLVSLVPLGAGLVASSFVLYPVEASQEELASIAPTDGSEQRPADLAAPAGSFRKWLRNESWRPWRVPYQLLPDFYYLDPQERKSFYRKTVDLVKKAPGRVKTFFADKPYRGVVVLVALLALCRRRVRGWSRRLFLVLIPGPASWRRGRFVRAYLSVWLFVFACGPVLWLVRVKTLDPAVASPGSLSAMAGARLFIPSEDFALPPPGNELLMAEYFWPLLWAYPYAKPFYCLVALALSAVLCLQVREGLAARVLRLPARSYSSSLVQNSQLNPNDGRNGNQWSSCARTTGTSLPGGRKST